MKNKKYNYSALALATALLFVFSLSCTRDMDELELAKFPDNPEIFIDGFSEGLNYAAFGGSKVTAFDVDQEVKFSGSSSMKIEVPDAGDPEGAYAGGVYYTTVGRDLSGYDALTFWAKASEAATIDVVGFGNDLEELKYLVTMEGVAVNSNWKKYIIPIPDPSKLTQERGMFYYSEGPEDGLGYTFWIDEVKFEKLGTIAHRKPMILGGDDKVESAVNGLKFPVGGLKVSFNMPTGIDQTVIAAPAYFTFSSSNAGVATVDATGLVTVLSEGSAVITATSGGVNAEGSLTVQSAGDFTHAPEPTAEQEDVISIFSNKYVNVPVDFYNGYWQPWQTTTSADFTVGEDDVLFYTNFNFVGIQFTAPTIDATNMTHLHMDIYIPNEVDPAEKLSVKLVDMGSNGILDDTDPFKLYEIAGPLASQSWISVDIDISGFASRSKLAQIILERIGSSLTGFYLDNVYLHGNGGGTVTEPAEAAPTPPGREPGDVISVYGDEYDNLEGTDYPDWGQTTVVSDVQIAGNSTLKFAGLNYQGIQLAASQDLTGMEYLHLDFWTANSTALNVFLISTGPVEAAKVLTVPTSGWTSVDIPLTDFSGVDLADIIQMKFDGNGDIYLDNIYFYKTGGGTASGPTTAPADPPARDAADVISVYGEAYGTEVGLANVDWDAGSLFAEETIAGNKLLKIDFVDFLGTQLNTVVDATVMTNFHMDIWIDDDFEAGQIFNPKWSNHTGGAGETNAFELTKPIGESDIRKWISIDVPISQFTGDNTRADLTQFLISVAGKIDVAYVDNIYFYKDGGGGTATEPTTAAPTPSQAAADVISLFSDAYTSVTVDTWRTDWSSAVLEDVSIEGNAAKKYSALDFVGILTEANKIDASEMTHIHIDVWSADFTEFSLKLVDFGADGAYAGGDDVEHQLNFASPAQGEWVSYDIPLSDFTNLTTREHIAQYILVGKPTGATTIWVDNFYFYGGGGSTATEPTAPAPAPTEDAGDVISLFSDAYTDVTVDTWRTDWSSATLEEVTVAGNAAKKYSALDFVGILTEANKVDASGMTHIHLDVWSADITEFSLKLVDFGADGAYAGGDDVEHQLTFASPAQGVWVSYDIPLSNFTSLTTREHIAQYILVGKPTGATTIWIDNFYFYNDGGSGGETGPAVAAPTPPARDANDVISLFSGAYSDVTIDNWDADWGNNCNLENIQVEGDDIKKYVCDAFAAVDFSGNKFNASAMTHFHIDLWTPTPVLDKSLTVKLVDFGGGSAEATNLILTVVHTAVGDVEALQQGTWVSVDVPISAFSGDLTRTDLAQMALTTNLGTIYVDNIYFYK